MCKVICAAYDLVVRRAFVVMVEVGVDERCQVEASVNNVNAGFFGARNLLVPSVALMYANWTPSDLSLAQLRLLPCQLETSHP